MSTPPVTTTSEQPQTSPHVVDSSLPHQITPQMIRGPYTERHFASQFMSSSSTRSSTRYSPVYKTPENHVDELKTRFQAMNQNIRISLIGDRLSPQSVDVQQSIGSDVERESDTGASTGAGLGTGAGAGTGAYQIRSPASSLSGALSDTSSISSPKLKRNMHSRDRVKWHVEQHETDF